jgi:hypothetical protein
MLGYMKEHQLQIIVAVWRKKYPHKPIRGYAAHKNAKTPDISATHLKFPHVKEIASRGTTPEGNTNIFCDFSF